MATSGDVYVNLQFRRNRLRWWLMVWIESLKSNQFSHSVSKIQYLFNIVYHLIGFDEIPSLSNLHERSKTYLHLEHFATIAQEWGFGTHFEEAETDVWIDDYISWRSSHSPQVWAAEVVWGLGSCVIYYVRTQLIQISHAPHIGFIFLVLSKVVFWRFFRVANFLHVMMI